MNNSRADLISARNNLEKTPKGTPERKDAEEIYEAALVRECRRICATSRNPWADVLALHDRQVALKTRTGESMWRNAYSTPLPLAYLVSEFCRPTDGWVYDPTAGNGALLMACPADRAIANEILEGRCIALESQGFAAVAREDAHRYVPPKKDIESVACNPPFGRDPTDARRTFYPGFLLEENGAAQFGQYETRNQGWAIALDAACRVRPGGRMALILPSYLERAPEWGGTKREFVSVLTGFFSRNRCLRADGDLYAKQGANFPVEVFLLSGRRRWATPPAGDLFPPPESTARGWEAVRRYFNPDEPKPPSPLAEDPSSPTTRSSTE